MKEKLWQHGKIIIASTIFIVIVSVLMEGMWLPGIPKIEDVQSVAVTDLRHSTEAKEFSDGESIELAVKLSGFLKYKPLLPVKGPSDPVVTITYYLKDGSSQSLSANENTVWWKAKPISSSKKKPSSNSAKVSSSMRKLSPPIKQSNKLKSKRHPHGCLLLL